MKQTTEKRAWWSRSAAYLCVFACVFASAFIFIAPNTSAQQADSSRLITSGIGKGQAAAQRTLSEIQTLNTLENQQEARINAQEAAVAGERAALNATTGDIDQVETDLATLDTDVQAVESDLATIGQHARTAISSICTGSQKLNWNGSAWECNAETDPSIGLHAKTSRVPPDCNPSSQKLIWNGSNWACATDVPGVGPQGPQGPAGADGPDGADGPSLWSTSGSNIYYNTGRVGVGTSSPATPLHVGGDMRVTSQLIVGGLVIPGNASLCDASREGAIRYNASTDAMALCQNGDWINVLLGSAAPCPLPWGGVILHTQSTTAYASSTVPYGSSCNGQTRTCNNGILSGSYTNATCTVNPPNNCNVSPWGTITDSTSVTAYASNSVACGGSCSSQNRTCNNGVLSGSYAYASCSVGACANCSLDGATVNHGSSRTFYQTSRACGASCGSVGQTRTCTNGSLSGSGAYSKASCPAQDPCGCNLPWGGSIANGASVTAYLSSSVACGSSCTSQTRSCSGGSLSGSYTNASCSVGSCSNCSLDGATVNHGSSRTFYTSTSVPCGSSCNGGSRSCNNGTLSGSSSYNRANCSVAGCSNCSLDGATTAHGSSRTYYLSSRSCGQACSAIDLSRSCNNGTLSGSGSYNKASCPAQTCSNCSLDGATTSHGSSRTYYLSSRSCGQACTAIDLSRSCNNGTLSGSSSYNKRNCPAEVCSCSATSATSFSGTETNGTFIGIANATFHTGASTAAACKSWCETEKAKVCLFSSTGCAGVWSGSGTMTVDAGTYTSRWSCTGGTSSTKPCSYNSTAVSHGQSRNPVCGLCSSVPGGSATCNNGSWSTMSTQRTSAYSNCTGCKVICTELYDQGLLSEEVYKADQLYGRTISSPAAMKVYSLWGVPTAQLMAKSPLVTAIVRPLATAWAEHMAYEMGVSEDDNLLGRTLRMTFLPLHEALGAIFYPELNETPSADKPGMPSESIPVATLPGLRK